ncbi:hypothetical protein L3Q82_002023 [Scortum barcoo]|uniref:Uncharacterized protein n=1 Tax=Scortum barcoo TaxID=214431 RepID=A0ACB8W1R8_9TELE|nr:hypothetical protein L3Q82_002023 [Scortum barcoo]
MSKPTPARRCQLTLGNSRVVEGPAPLKELGSRAQAMRGGIGSSRLPATTLLPKPHCTGPSWTFLRVVSLLEGGPTSPFRAEPGRVPWAKTRPPGARLRAPTPGLAPGWGPGPVCHGRPYQGRNAPDNIAPRIIRAHKPLHHSKVAVQGGGTSTRRNALTLLSGFVERLVKIASAGFGLMTGPAAAGQTAAPEDPDRTGTVLPAGQRARGSGVRGSRRGANAGWRTASQAKG